MLFSETALQTPCTLGRLLLLLVVLLLLLLLLMLVVVGGQASVWKVFAGQLSGATCSSSLDGKLLGKGRIPGPWPVSVPVQGFRVWKGCGAFRIPVAATAVHPAAVVVGGMAVEGVIVVAADAAVARGAAGAQRCAAPRAGSNIGVPTVAPREALAQS